MLRRRAHTTFTRPVAGAAAWSGAFSCGRAARSVSLPRLAPALMMAPPQARGRVSRAVRASGLDRHACLQDGALVSELQRVEAALCGRAKWRDNLVTTW